jgi:hypothetical protein
MRSASERVAREGGRVGRRVSSVCIELVSDVRRESRCSRRSVDADYHPSARVNDGTWMLYLQHLGHNPLRLRQAVIAALPKPQLRPAPHEDIAQRRHRRQPAAHVDAALRRLKLGQRDQVPPVHRVFLFASSVSSPSSRPSVPTHQHSREALRPAKLPRVQIAQQRVPRLDHEATRVGSSSARAATDHAGLRGRDEGLSPCIDVGAVSCRVDLREAREVVV